LRIYEDLDICQHTVLNLDKYVLRRVLAGVGMTRNPAESDLNVLDFLTSEITDHVELMDNRIIDEHLVGKIFRHFGNSMRTVEHQELPQLAGRDYVSQALISSVEATHEANLDTFLSKSLLCLQDFPGGRRVRR
jgi:hypothetical protein